MQPLLSVIVLSLGAPPALTGALQSLLSQDEPVEILVVNSGGGDPRARLPAGAGVPILDIPERLYAGAARNRGIAGTSAPYVAFLASDCRAEPGWVAARLAAHRGGAAAVGSAIVNTQPGLASAASHAMGHGARDPRIGQAGNLHYGGSYARWLFDWYGGFREDLRIGEDTEFNVRLAPEHRPVWDARVQTSHLNPLTPWALIYDQFRRGRRLGEHWPGAETWTGSLRSARRQAVWAVRRMRQLSPQHAGPLGTALLVTNTLASRAGFLAGRPVATAQAVHQSAACLAALEGNWRRAAGHLGNATPPVEPDSALAAATLFARGGMRERALGLVEGAAQAAPQNIALATAAARFSDEQGGRPAAWRALVQRFGERESLLFGLGWSLLRHGDFDEAAATFEIMNARWPLNGEGLRGLAEVAIRRADWPAALEVQTGMWEATGSTASLAAMIVSLHRMQRWEDARQWTERLRAAGAEQLWFTLSVDGLRRATDWPRLLDFVTANRDIIDASVPALETIVRTLNMGNHSAVSLELIRDSRLPRGVRHQLEVSTLLYQGATEAAWRAASRPNPRALLNRLHLVRPLIAAAYSVDGPSAARDLLDRMPESTAPARALVLAHERVRMDALDALTADPPRLVDDRAVRLRALEAARGNPELAGEYLPGMLGWMRETLAAGTSAPDPDTSLWDAVEIAERIVEAIRRKDALSLIRLGDGDGTILPYRPELQSLQRDDVGLVTAVWWGRDMGGHPRWSELVEALAQSSRNATILGVADAMRLVRTAWRNDLRERYSHSNEQRGLLAVMDFAAASSGAQTITSCHIHQAFAFWGLWNVILSEAGRVSLVTCHAGLGAALTARFGVAIADTHLIPAETKYASRFEQALEGVHFPDVFDRLRPALASVAPGHVVLVAAGVLGKIYCEWIRAAGGIALDVGSAADHWCGHATRTTEENAAYASPPHIEERLGALAAVDPRIARLMGRA